MRPFDDPSSLTPDQRLAAVANILAAGILRLQTRAVLSTRYSLVWSAIGLLASST